MSDSSAIQVAAFYRFAAIADPVAVRAGLEAVCLGAGVKGTLLVADEGINGALAGSRAALETVIDHVRALAGFAELDVKYAAADRPPFHRLKVRVKPEIVTLGEPGVDPVRNAGTYVSAADWNALISEPDTVIIDTRNDYEVAVGTFPGAVHPNARTFRDFPAWFRSEGRALLDRPVPPKVAMFCTGGIRCEKATAFLKAEGVDRVHHLEGGVLRYLETVPPEESLWRGECFVFDQRVAVGPGLSAGTHVLCHGCRMPVSPEGQRSPLYREGVACPACHADRDEDQRRRYAERQRQVEIAQDRGIAHVGARLDKRSL